MSVSGPATRPCALCARPLLAKGDTSPLEPSGVAAGAAKARATARPTMGAVTRRLTNADTDAQISSSMSWRALVGMLAAPRAASRSPTRLATVMRAELFILYHCMTSHPATASAILRTDATDTIFFHQPYILVRETSRALRAESIWQRRGAEVSEVSEQAMKQNRPAGTFLSGGEAGATAIVMVGLGRAFPKG